MFKAIRRHWLPIVMLLMLAVGWNLTYTPTGSMEPTIKTWHIYSCVRWPFAPEPERGDIVLYRDGWRVYCKRLVGLPGDLVYIHDGIVETPDGVQKDKAVKFDKETGKFSFSDIRQERKRGLKM